MKHISALPSAAPGTLLVACLLLSAGCGGGPQFAEVEGTLTLNGKPLPDAEVAFLPDPEQGFRGPQATSYTDAQGHYRLRCEAAHKKGAAVGIYRVCIHDIAALPSPDLLDPANPARLPGMPPTSPPRADKAKAARVPQDYASPATTPFRDVEVKAGKQTLDFDVKSSKK
jgi:hypothetical protein